jgi:class 3 adenylate cyclase
MNLVKWGWITSKLLIVLIVPTLIYIWTCQYIFASHLKSVVTNDPDAGLTRSMTASRMALDEEYQSILLQISHTTDKDWLQKYLNDTNMTLAQYRQLGDDLVGYLQRPLLVLADKNGGVLFDTIGLPKPGTLPAYTPTIAPFDTYINPDGSPKPTAVVQPALFSVKNWPGFTGAFEKNTEMGLFSYGNQYYLSVCSPIVSRKKIIGAMLLGIKLNSDVMERLKYISQNDIAFYANNNVQISTFPSNASSDISKTAFAPKHSAITVNDQNFLWDDVPINDLDQIVAGHFFIFQPIHESITVNGSALKPLAQLSLIFILVMMALGLWYTLDLLSPLRQMTRQINLVKEGQWNASLPVKRHDGWGDLARSIQDAIQNLKDKERVTLVLGKVVSPLTTQKILAEKNYFAIRGERRECTLLQTQINGFNTLSQNMTPEVLVEVLNYYLGLINQVVFKHDGMVDKFVGDTAIAVWGAPFTHEDKEIRAVRTALEIQSLVKELNITRIQKGHAPFNLGIGIHTGPVVAGNLGSDQYYDYSVIGEPLQTVGKVCAMAAPGQVLVAEETYEKIKDLVSAAPEGSFLVLGSKEPIKTYEIHHLL